MPNVNPPPTFDAFTLAAVIAELRETVQGATVQKVYQPAPNDLILSLFGKAGARRILVCVDPRLFRVHLTTAKRPNPQNPPAFCMLCRKYLEGADLAEIVQPRFDRVVNFVFRASDGERFTLAVELMGRNANAVLVSGAGLVRGTLRPVPQDNERSLRSGAVYALPPDDPERVNPLSVSGPDDAVWRDLPTDTDAQRTFLAQTFAGISKFAALEVVERAKSASLAHVFADFMNSVRVGTFAPHAVLGDERQAVGVWAFAPLTVPPLNRAPVQSIGETLEDVYRQLSEEGAEESERAILARVLARETQFRHKEIKAADATLAVAARADSHEQTGNNLFASLHLVERGAVSVTIPDLYDAEGGVVTVALDPKKTPQENATAYFDRARKARDAGEFADGRKADLEDELERLAILTTQLETAQTEADYASIREGLADVMGDARARSAFDPQQKPKTAPRPFGGHKVRTFTVGAYELLVGETAEANDHLVTRVAAPSDWWFHVRATTGAHGVLRTNGQPDRVPDTVLRRAAEIVAARSGNVKHAGIVAVDIAQKRYVRKPRGAKAGTVTYERERTLDVEPKPA